MMHWIEGALGIAIAGFIARHLVAGLAIKKIHTAFESFRNSAWVREPSRPSRAKMLAAILACLEEELPDAGKGHDFYLAIGNKVASANPALTGMAGLVASVLEPLGDALDTELDADIKDLLSGNGDAPKVG